MKTVLITGVAGFIGSHLADKFLIEGYKVVGVDNFLTGKPENISHITNINFKFFEKDITKGIFDIENVDVILHFACPASPVDYMKYPIETMKVDSIGTFNMLEITETKKSRFILASTSEVYGDPTIHPQPESYWGNVNPTGQRSVYDEAKRFSEALTMAYFRKFGLDIRIVRIFNTYGPRMKNDDGRVVPNFINQALNGEPLTVYGDGSQTRSFCYVDDLVEGIYRLATYDNLNGEVINIGNPEEHTILEFTKIITDLTQKPIKIKFCPLPSDDPKKRKPDITKAQKLLNWNPVTSLNEGLLKTIQWFKKLNKN